MVGRGSSGGGGEEGFTGRAAIGYDHGYDGEVFYLGLALDSHYVDGWVEGCLERIGEDHPEEELLFRDLWDEEIQRDVVIESLKADCEVRAGLWDNPSPGPSGILDTGSGASGGRQTLTPRIETGTTTLTVSLMMVPMS